MANQVKEAELVVITVSQNRKLRGFCTIHIGKGGDVGVYSYTSEMAVMGRASQLLSNQWNRSHGIIQTDCVGV